jgi:hypothetical protein
MCRATAWAISAGAKVRIVPGEERMLLRVQRLQPRPILANGIELADDRLRRDLAPRLQGDQLAGAAPSPGIGR